jgi:hypothetical protein
MGEVALHLHSPAGVFIYSSCGKCPFPPLLRSFPPTATFTSFPTPGCWVGATTLAFSSPARLFTVREGLPLPAFSAQGTPPSLLGIFFIVVVYYSVCFFLFSLGCGRSVLGAMLI